MPNTHKLREVIVHLKSIFSAVRQFIRELDKITLLVCVCASGISCICLYSFYVDNKITLKMVAIQGASVVLGVIAACIISKIDYHVMANLWKIHMPIAIFLVVLTFFIGFQPEGTDDKAWLNFGITTMQPSELLKLSFIFTFALHLNKVGPEVNKLKPFLILCVHGALPVGLIMLQGDYGTALVFLAIFMFMIFSAGLSAKLITVGLMGVVAAAPLIWYFVLPDYLQNRFMIALNPVLDKLDTGLQQYRGQVAMGSGQLSGRGLFYENLYEVPKAYNDFIFSYIGQTMGFVGGIITLLIIMFLCVKILLVAKSSKDKLGVYICVGVFAIFMFQSIINIGMVLCLVPVIGITLPFFSQGGTSMVVSYMAIGMVMSVYRINRKEFMFSD